MGANGPRIVRSEAHSGRMRKVQMNLLIRVNLVLGAIFALGALLASLIGRSALDENAQKEMLAEADLMVESAVAMRGYTANQVSPLLSDRMQAEFLPQSVPFYAATEMFLRLREKHPQYSYKEATLNPTNPRDRAADWEADIIQRFRNDPRAQEWIGERDTPMGRSMYLARPIRADAECLNCHSSPALAPRTVIARYGSDNGFGWQAHEVVGAQIVSVPLANAAARAQSASRSLVAQLIVLFLATLLAVNLAVYFIVVRPVRRVTQIADRLSLGETSASEFPAGGAAEVTSLARSFNRMRASLEKAMKLLET
jgi:HAMP domain-containing protein